MSVQSGGKTGVKELTGQISVELVIWEVVDQTMGIDRDVNAEDPSSREFLRLGGGDGRRREIFLFGERRHGFNGCGRSGG